MKTLSATAALLMALPTAFLAASSRAQTLQFPAFYGGVEGGANWMRDTSTSFNATGANATIQPNLGWSLGGVVGYDFVGPRLELEGNYRTNSFTANVAAPGNFAFQATHETISAMANVYYDFNAGNAFVPYVGVGIGADFTRTYASIFRSENTSFAYQAILGVGYNVNELFRVNLDGRYHGSLTQPSVLHSALGSGQFTNNNWSVMASVHLKFAPVADAPAAPPPPAAAPAPASFMVFFDFDRSDLSSVAQATIKQASDAYKTKGSARLTAVGHTDRSGPEAYNMALSLRRANSVKDALVRNGVPDNAIVTVGRGESMPLVQTADGVREAQNRRVEIVLQ